MYKNCFRYFKNINFRSTAILVLIVFGTFTICLFYTYDYLSIYKDNFINFSNEYVGYFSSFNACQKSNDNYTPFFIKVPEEFNSNVDSHPNLPSFLLRSSNVSSLIPEIYNIRWAAKYWQESWANQSKFYLYSAHFDRREKLGSNHEGYRTYVRILSLYDGNKSPSTSYCQLWLNETHPLSVLPVYRYDVVDWQGFQKDQLVPYMLSCIVPNAENKTPIAVSLLDSKCSLATNILHITGVNQNLKNADRREDRNNDSVASCGPALYYYNEDFSHRLTEWIEVMLSVGIAKIFMYKTDNHPNVNKVLDHYEAVGVVKTVSFSYPPPYVDDPIFRKIWVLNRRSEMFAMENIYFTDCVLRFKDKFRYIAHFDPDEVPILKDSHNMTEFIKFLKGKFSRSHPPAFFKLNWKTFYPDLPPANSGSNIPDRFHILRHDRIANAKNPIFDQNWKSIYDTSQVLAVYSHAPLLFVDGIGKKSKRGTMLDTSEAYLAHYRIQKCGDKCSNDKYLVEDSLLQHKDRVIKNVNFVLKNLDIEF